jgi:hypothetical protein
MRNLKEISRIASRDEATDPLRIKHIDSQEKAGQNDQPSSKKK